jgi:hypothetical protein
VVAQRALSLGVRLLGAARDRPRALPLLGAAAGARAASLLAALATLALAQRLDPLEFGLDPRELVVALGAVAVGLDRGVVADDEAHARLGIGEGDLLDAQVVADGAVAPLLDEHRGPRRRGAAVARHAGTID